MTSILPDQRNACLLSAPERGVHGLAETHLRSEPGNRGVGSAAIAWNIMQGSDGTP